MGRSAANGSPPLRCFFGAALPRRQTEGKNPATRYMLSRNAANIIKMLFLFLAEK